VYLETTYQHLQGLDKDSRRKAKARTKDPRLKAKARTKDYKFVLKDNQGPRTKAKDNITAVAWSFSRGCNGKSCQIRGKVENCEGN